MPSQHEVRPRAWPSHFPPWARSAAFAAVGAIATLVLGGAPWLAAAIAGAVLVVAAAERAATHASDSARAQVALRAARTEGERGSVAQVMSLELAYERSHSVLEALREGVLVVDGSGEIVLANPAARRAMRQPSRDPSGQPLWEALVPELAQRAREAWLALHDSPQSETELPQIRYPAIPCRDSIYDLTAVQATSRRTGQDFGSVFLLVDSTRAHELQRLKDRFLSSISHELRTPLTNVCAYAEILRHMLPGESAEWPEFVRVIHEEGLQLSRIVDGMFDFLQLESGDAVFDSESLDGAGIAAAVAAEFKQVARARDIELVVRMVVEPPPFMGDRRRFEQVVRNLVDNAVKFTPDGGQVRVTIGAHDAGFELRIEDSGPGVPPNDRTAVFDKFHQLSDHLTDKPAGPGLGLATSRAIVARLGGLIWCEDSPLGGAGFVVVLPGTGQPRLAAVGAGTGAGGGF